MRRILLWTAEQEIWLVLLAAPLLMFPNRYTPVALALVVLPRLARLLAEGRLTVRTPMDLPIIVIVLMTLVSLYPSVSLYLSWQKLAGILLGVAVFYAMANCLKTGRSIWYATAALCLGGVAVALVSLVGTDWSSNKLFDASQVSDYLPRLTQLMPKSALPTAREGFNPNEVGGVLAMLIPVPLALLLSRRMANYRASLGLATLVMGGTLVLSQSRSAFFGLAVALLLLVVLKFKKALLLLPLVVAALVFLAYTGGLENLKNVMFSMESPSGMAASLRPEDRVQLWWTAAQMIQDFPVTGIGLNTFPLVMENMYPVFTGFYRMPHAHNLFLQTAVDLGIPGLLAFLGLLAAFGLTIVRVRRSATERNARDLALGLACGVTAYLVYGLTDAFTLGAKPGVFFWAMLGLAVALPALHSSPVENVARELDSNALATAQV